LVDETVEVPPVIRRLLLALPLLLAACATPPAEPPPATVASVDLARYAGTWHEIARFPNRFQDGGGRACTNTTATYTARPDGTVGVVNRCRDARGEEQVATASAYAVEGSGNAKLRVTFFWPFYGDYWVIGLDPEYRWAVVGAPGRNYLWVLSRTAAMSEADYAAAVAIALGQGFEVQRLVRGEAAAAR
jgi:apolipoprotein D and lipocalin family protein